MELAQLHAGGSWGSEIDTLGILENNSLWVITCRSSRERFVNT
jgi:hypothetical protein